MIELDNLHREYLNKYWGAKHDENASEMLLMTGALQLLDRLIEEKTAGMDLVGDDESSEDYLEDEDMVEPDSFC